MSTPITEAHYDLRRQVIFSDPDEGAQLIADSEAEAVQIAMLREYGNLCATNESLAKERDQLRAEVERLKKQIKDDNISYGCELRDPYGTIWEQATEDHARAERAEAAMERLSEWQAGVTENARAHHAELKDAIARAERAEAEVKRFTAHGLLDCHAICDQRDAAIAERDQLRAELAAAKLLLNEETDCAEAVEAAIVRQYARAERAEAELAAALAGRDDLVADLNDACITLASATDDCDDYALLNTRFKLTAVRDVLIQYIPNAAMKEGA
jgi:hypothetical protein